MLVKKTYFNKFSQNWVNSKLPNSFSLQNLALISQCYGFAILIDSFFSEVFFLFFFFASYNGTGLSMTSSVTILLTFSRS
jgi:hypothetical protein